MDKKIYCYMINIQILMSHNLLNVFSLLRIADSPASLSLNETN